MIDSLNLLSFGAMNLALAISVCEGVVIEGTFCVAEIFDGFVVEVGRVTHDTKLDTRNIIEVIFLVICIFLTNFRLPVVFVIQNSSS
jgi:hypothetical protein